MSAMSAMAAVAPNVQARFGARSDKVVKARRAVVLNAVTEPEATAGDAPKPKPKRKFVKKNVTVQDADIAVGNEYSGKVKRVQEYGCFVDFGAKSDGLVHISELTNGFVESVGDVVSEGQDVQVWIKTIDAEKGRFSLTMKPPPSAEEMEAFAAKEAEREAKFQARREQKQATEAAMSKVKSIKKGQQVEGVVKSIQPFGAFVEIQEGVEGLVHVTEMSEDYNIRIEDFCTVGATVKVRILGVDGNKVKLSMKEKLDLKEMVEGIQVEAGAGVMEFALKTKGVSPAQFPGFAELEKAKEAAAKAEAATAEATAAAPAEEEEAAAAPEPVAEEAAAPAEEPAAEEPAAEAEEKKEEPAPAPEVGDASSEEDSA